MKRTKDLKSKEFLQLKAFMAEKLTELLDKTVDEITFSLRNPHFEENIEFTYRLYLKKYKCGREVRPVLTYKTPYLTTFRFLECGKDIKGGLRDFDFLVAYVLYDVYGESALKEVQRTIVEWKKV